MTIRDDGTIRLLTQEQVQDKLQCSRAHVWRLRQTPDFPKPLKIGSNSLRWVEADLDAYLRHIQECETVAPTPRSPGGDVMPKG